MNEMLKKEEVFLNDIRGIINSARQNAVRSVDFCRQFYRVYPIANALRSQLNWTQYRMLIQIDDPDKRMYYELESVNNGWTARENLLSASCSAPTKTIQQYAWLYPKIIKPYWQANTNFICLRKHN